MSHEEALSVKCLDDGQTYMVDPLRNASGLVETGGVVSLRPGDVGASSWYGVVGPQEMDEETKASAAESVQRSSKARVGRRLRESVGLSRKTKDVNFEAARLRMQVHGQRLAKVEEAIMRRDALFRQLAACEADLAARLEELAASSPMEGPTAALARDVERRRRGLERDLLPKTTSSLTEYVKRWRDDLHKSDLETAKEFESARVQLDHYGEKAEKLRKAKEKRDLAALDKAAVAAAKRDAGDPAAAQPVADKKVTERYERNEVKLKAARDDFEATTAAAIRVYDAAVIDRWHDLAPFLGQLWQFETDHAKLCSEDKDLEACRVALNALPPVAPLRSRLYHAKTGNLPRLKDFPNKPPPPPALPPSQRQPLLQHDPDAHLPVATPLDQQPTPHRDTATTSDDDDDDLQSTSYAHSEPTHHDLEYLDNEDDDDYRGSASTHGLD